MFIVIEFMIDKNGNPGSFTYTFATENEAKAKFYTVMAAAATSDTRSHGATLLNEALMQMMRDCIFKAAE